MAVNDISFESFLAKQSTALLKASPHHFKKNWTKLAKQALEWFDIDRISIYKSSGVMFSDDSRLLWTSRDGFLPWKVTDEVIKSTKAYLKNVKSLKPVHFQGKALHTLPAPIAKQFMKADVRWHCIIPIKVHNQRWGAISMSCHGEGAQALADEQIIRIQLLCEMWVGYWQYAVLTENLKPFMFEKKDQDELELLSLRQREILTLIATGLTANECAEKLSISARTVESHKYRLLNKLNLDSSAELLKFALRNGLMNP